MSGSARNPSRGPILVTGSIRSGTTWVGGMLALAPGVEIVHEPFNPATGPGVFRVPITRQFEYVHAANEQPYLEALQDTLAFRYGHLRQLARPRCRAWLAGSLRDARRFSTARRSGARPLIKDALAVLSAEWIASRFDAEVVVLVRHPAAFVSSLLRLGWNLDCAWLAEQPQLLRDHLPELADEIRARRAEPGTPLERATLFWRAIYAVVRGYRERHPGWHIRRHEDLAADASAAFEDLYDRLGLEYTGAVRGQVVAHSAQGNPVECRSAHDIRLDSRASIGGWRRRLTAGQIDEIRSATADVWPDFYTDADWQTGGAGLSVGRGIDHAVARAAAGR